MKPSGFFATEAAFQSWVVTEIEGYGGHAQSLTGDDKCPGIPDLSAGIKGQELWAELKLYRRSCQPTTTLAQLVGSGREITAQQQSWLHRRWAAGRSSCGILFAWNMGEVGYVTFVPITEWKTVLQWRMADIIMLSSTQPLSCLILGLSKIHYLILGAKGGTK